MSLHTFRNKYSVKKKKKKKKKKKFSNPFLGLKLGQNLMSSQDLNSINSC